MNPARAETLSEWARSVVQFACGKCGSPAVSIPTELSPEAAVQCARCGHEIGTWSELQALARDRATAPHAGKERQFSADPVGEGAGRRGNLARIMG